VRREKCLEQAKSGTAAQLYSGGIGRLVPASHSNKAICNFNPKTASPRKRPGQDQIETLERLQVLDVPPSATLVHQKKWSL
jgi:hypothetical protein